MKIKSVELTNFRNHKKFAGTFSPTVTMICGDNGTGKTSILEAIYIAYRGSSFRGADHEATSARTKWFRLRVDDTTDLMRQVAYDNRDGAKQRKVTVDNHVSARLPRKHLYPVVLFLPDDTQLINGSPTRRRDYFDRVIMQYNPLYAPLVRRYERALLQRNKLLKHPGVTAEQLFPWDIILSDTGAEIIRQRSELVGRIQQSLERYYEKIASIKERVSLEYSHPGVTSQSLVAQLERAYEHDVVTGNTPVGPHRHDFLFNLRSQPASTLASRGEVRTIVLALKYIEADIIRDIVGEEPLILLDDVFGELDTSRQKQLLEIFSGNQVIITSTENHKSGTIISL